jgi:ABC-type lipoprotein export system ATPase subunit
LKACGGGFGEVVLAKGLWKEVASHRRAILRDVSLSLEPGEMLAVTGPSGAGKSTLLNILGCIDRPSSGYLAILGSVVDQLSPEKLGDLRARSIGFVHQEPHLVRHLNVRENVELAFLYGKSRVPSDFSRKVSEVLEALGLSGLATMPPARLSGGERGRVALARALVRKPRLLLADEPTAGLDETASRCVEELLASTLRGGTAIVVATHDKSLGTLCERQLRLEGGVPVAAA